MAIVWTRYDGICAFVLVRVLMLVPGRIPLPGVSALLTEETRAVGGVTEADAIFCMLAPCDDPEERLVDAGVEAGGGVTEADGPALERYCLPPRVFSVFVVFSAEKVSGEVDDALVVEWVRVWPCG